MIARISANRAVGGSVAAPPSKSAAHRAVLCAALADGRSRILNLEYSQDVCATLNAITALGAKAETGSDYAVIDGISALQLPVCPIDCCESGSTLRFLIPLASLSGEAVRFTGRGRLMERPQSVYEDIFQRQGLRFARGADALEIEGSLHAGEYELAGDVSSQFISGLLFALPKLAEPSVLKLRPPVESRSYIEMTRAVQSAFGIKSSWQDENTLYIPGGQKYTARDYTVEGDYSQAAFVAVLGALTGGVTVTGLTAETIQGDAVILDILRQCGAGIEAVPGGFRFYKQPLHGIDIDLADCPDLGPVLMVLGLFCEGTTTIHNAGRLRIKESDRIAAMEDVLGRCGGEITSSGGTVTIHRSTLHAPEAPLSAHNDHRVVMSLAVLALSARLTIEISGAEAIRKSWPSFFTAVRQLGGEVSEID